MVYIRISYETEKLIVYFYIPNIIGPSFKSSGRNDRWEEERERKFIPKNQWKKIIQTLEYV